MSAQLRAVPSNPNQLATAIEQAANALSYAKAREKIETEARLRAESGLLELLRHCETIPTEGTVTTTHGQFKIAVRCSINRTIDRDALCQIAPTVPEEVAKRLFRWKPELDLKELRYLESNEPAIYALVAQAITAKPAKPSISVEAVEG